MYKNRVKKTENTPMLQWHPAFFAGIQIELAEDADYLEFIQEYALGTKPMEIDVLIKKEENRVIKKNIGRIFRKYNIIEYKSPSDYLSIDDYYKVYAYTYSYKVDRITVNSVLLTELTISLISKGYPRRLMKHLKEEREFQIEERYPGIYYILGDVLPVQIVVTSRLSRTESLWLRNLTNQIGNEKDVEELLWEYQKHPKNKLYESVMNVIVAANEEKFREAKEMCEALRKLMQDELEAERLGGEESGKDKVNELNLKLSQIGRVEDIIRAAGDKTYQKKLFKEFGL